MRSRLEAVEIAVEALELVARSASSSPAASVRGEWILGIGPMQPHKSSGDNKSCARGGASSGHKSSSSGHRSARETHGVATARGANALGGPEHLFCPRCSSSALLSPRLLGPEHARNAGSGTWLTHGAQCGADDQSPVTRRSKHVPLLPPACRRYDASLWLGASAGVTGATNRRLPGRSRPPALAGWCESGGICVILRARGARLANRWSR
mmetsp:Transcript_127943/g.409912  ORF Transcript_127943/g.409912 Transcript_127943/m.409912 type:complete len:210 (+) Transcript_127943:538-1167(+)